MSLAQTELYDANDERVVLAVLLKDNNFIVNLDKWDLKPETFYWPEHQALFSAIISTYNEKGSVDSYIVCNRLKTLGLTKFNDLDIFQYVTGTLMKIPVSKDHYGSYLEDLCRWYYLREADLKFANGRKSLRAERGKPLGEIKGMVDLIASDVSTINVSNLDDEFVDLYGSAEQTIKGIAERGEPMGLYSPWKSYNDMYGPLSYGDSFIFAAKSKVGKSTILAALQDYLVKTNDDVYVLILDTEMDAMRVQCRNLAAETSENEFYYRNGGYVNSEQMVSKSEEVFEKWKDLSGRVFHIYAADKPIDEVEALVKRFHGKHVKNNGTLLVVYDYLKETGESTDKDPEWAVMSRKGNALKKLAQALPRTIVITAVQLNQEGNVSQSSRLLWTASQVVILHKKSPEDIENHTDQFGTHFLETLVTRSQGENNEEYVSFEQGTEKKWIKNNINFLFKNFRVDDLGTYKEMIEKLAIQGRQLTLVKPKQSWKKEVSKF